MLSFILFTTGLAILVKGADFLVDGASSLASRFKISPIAIGLTVVAFGTSTPELVVSLTSAFRGNTDIALGNVIGSNIFNILFILGLSAIIFPLKVIKNTAWKEIPFSFLGTIILAILGLQVFINTGSFSSTLLSSADVIGVINRAGGLVLLSFFIIFLYYTFGISKTTGSADIDIKKRSIAQILLLIAMGLAALTFGSQIAVENAIAIARTLNISDTLIGFTLVAAGTSFPELFTNIAAVRKKNPDIAVGNIVGSNIFNIFLILGVTSIFRDIPIRGIQVVDIIILLITTSILFISIFLWKKHSIGRKEGFIMLIGYIAYTVFLIMRG
jgi:cation:H+ antiporter